MFEKEAKEYRTRFENELYLFDNTDIFPNDIEKAYHQGAEFGYNKANEWHYVKDGDLPKDEDWKWCVSYRGYYYVAKYEEMFGCWTNQEYSEVMQPHAWKEIVIPELPKEIE